MALHVHSFFYFSFLIIIIVVIIFSAAPSVSQPQAVGSCNGILLSYVYTGGSWLPPNVSDPTEQPYRFSSMLTVLNNGLEELKSWRVFLGFQHGEWLVFASNAVLANGTSLPGSVENGTMQVRVDMLGTLLGVAPPAVPMPSSVTLANDGFLCGQPSGQGTYLPSSLDTYALGDA
ncbi:hypothetical protein JHK82_042323 [Glycine max]|nr:hypothetical protein JHK82_042323 [Glycine max]KAG5116479.1 hypothetical protein JHK84_042592 [Glycine max]